MRSLMLVLLLLAGAPAGAQQAHPLAKCAPDAVVAGTVCMDRYEASAWRVPDALGRNRSLVKRIQDGRVTAAQLVAAGATQLGVGDAEDFGACGTDGEGCVDEVFAVSVAGVRPSANVSWLQAQAACENARKRLPTNAEWQAAVAGTPNPGGDDGVADCATSISTDGVTVPTGSRAKCRSRRGAFDMVGNVDEWVADWVPPSTVCATWAGQGDTMCFGGATDLEYPPAALIRGGGVHFADATLAGPLAVNGHIGVRNTYYGVGFRCAR